MDEQALIARCQAGERSAFEELLGNYENLVFNLAHRYFGNQAEAADVAQEAMLRIYRRLGEFKGRSAFKTWVYRVVTNVCLDALRKKNHPSISLDEVSEDGRALVNPASDDPGPDQQLEMAELGDLLRQLLGALAADHRVILVLRDMEGLSYEEIAETLGCSLGTVKSRLARAREALRKKLVTNPQAAGWIEGRMRA